MLRGLDPLLGPDLLATLRGMGHDDEIALVDGNYPAVSHAQRLIRAGGQHLLSILRAVLSVFPLDSDVEQPVTRICNASHPDRPDPVHVAIDAVLLTDLAVDQIAVTQGVDFYDRVRRCHAIVATSEPALFCKYYPAQGRDIVTGAKRDAAPLSRNMRTLRHAK